MNNNLSYLWLKENLRKEITALKRVDKAYESLKNKKTTYAQGVLKLKTVREEIVKIWEGHYNETVQ